ncbi:Hsp70 family protein [Methyloversatilis thermotolerans]|uniref:Hsp70 family protein n=1 Tax=Methyloversatilis thermotolerans TaxID=1346290 RepID=UPI00037003FD|nr:Hsp70 family protein [Methyloversatilis thermotolerans]
MTSSALGLDFGTSNSTAAIHDDDALRLLPLEDGKATLPSAVFFNLDEDSTAVGRAALAEYLEGYEGRLMRAMKSLLGSSLMDAGTDIGGRHLAFRDLIGGFIRELKARAESAAQRRFDQVVVGRPVRFVDDDGEADALAESTLADIVRRAGFGEVSFQFEPIAAAHAFEQQVDRESLVLVIDIGGGTSDFSLVRLSPERRDHADRSADLLGNTGVHIGGTDFDKRLSLSAVMPELGMGGVLTSGAVLPNSTYFNLATWHTIHLAYRRDVLPGLQDMARDVVDGRRFGRLLRVLRERSGHHLAMRAEAAKIALSDAGLVPLDMDVAEEGLVVQIPRAQFEVAIDGEVARVCDAARQCVQQAGIRGDEVDTLFFTGGSSGVPALRRALSACFPRARAVEGDLYGSVGCGLAVVARQRYGG